jgi:hypothetical protein
MHEYPRFVEEQEAFVDPDLAREIPEPEFDRNRVQRIGWSLLGGALGAAFPFAVGTFFQATCSPVPGFRICVDLPWGLATGFLPFSYSIGATLPQLGFQGRAGPGWPLAGALGGYTLGLGFLTLISGIARQRWTDGHYAGPGIGLLSVFALAGGAISQELRNVALDDGAAAWPSGRTLLEGTVYAAGLTASGFALVGLAVALQVYGPGSIVFAVLGVTTGVVLSSLAAWGVHVALGGQGKFWGALVGAILAGSVGAGFALANWGSIFGGRFGAVSTAFFPTLGISALIGVAGPAMGLELTNGMQQPGEPENESDDLAVRISPMISPGGLGLSGTF